MTQINAYLEKGGERSKLAAVEQYFLEINTVPALQKRLGNFLNKKMK